MARKLRVDVYRILLLLVATGYGLYAIDETNIALFQALGFALFLVGGTHLTRRILFHRMDLQEIAFDAVNNRNMPAAVIFAAIVYFLVQVMHLSLGLLK